MILIDLQKAFDTIDHSILLKKLTIDNTITWFRSYLTNRLFLVNIDNIFSDPSKLSCGVPQGSILGSLLFLLYVNDMPQAVQSDLFLYADDTCLGVDKTKSILFSKRRKKENIHINRRDTTIIQHPKISNLECLLDEDLSGESMANKVLGKINGRLKFLHRKN